MKRNELKPDQIAEAMSHYESIARRVKVLKYLETRQDSDWREDFILRINEEALSVRVRDDWYSPFDYKPLHDYGENKPCEYEILLSWGGPAVRIIGKLNDYGEPESAVLQFQDWYIPWVDIEENGPLVDYARCWYFAE